MSPLKLKPSGDHVAFSNWPAKEIRSAAIYALRRRGDHFIDYWLAADWLGVLDQIGALQFETP
jgi:hypothetical protein